MTAYIIGGDGLLSGYTEDGFAVVSRKEFEKFMREKESVQQPQVNKETTSIVQPPESGSPEKRG